VYANHSVMSPVNNMWSSCFRPRYVVIGEYVNGPGRTLNSSVCMWVWVCDSGWHIKGLFIVCMDAHTSLTCGMHKSKSLKIMTMITPLHVSQCEWPLTLTLLANFDI